MNVADTATVRLILHPLSPAEAGRIVARTPSETDRWHAEYPFADELDPLRSLADAEETESVFTLYSISTRSDDLSVGGVGFFGPPDEDGVVVVGYGLIPAARGNGYGAEALTAAVQIAFAYGAKTVAADTGIANLPSQAVLRRAGFVEDRRTDELIFYRISLE